MSLHIQNPMLVSILNQQPPTLSEAISLEPTNADQATTRQIQPKKISSNAHPSAIFALAEILIKLADHLAARLERIANNQESRTATANDLSALEEALSGIKEDAQPPYTAETFNVPVTLEYGSPAAGKNLWSALVHYGLQKAGDAPPKDTGELDTLIGKVKSKTMSLTTLSDETITRMNQIAGNRENYLSQATELLMRELKLMLSILNAR